VDKLLVVKDIIGLQQIVSFIRQVAALVSAEVCAVPALLVIILLFFPSLDTSSPLYAQTDDVLMKRVVQV